MVFRQLLWVRDLLTENSQDVPEALTGAIDRIAPALRALRLGDGSLTRFHGGTLTGMGALDTALAESRNRDRPDETPRLGYARLSAGRVTLLVDCARPPGAADRAHASTLGFEMSTGRRQMVVNSGPAIDWLEDWRRIPRMTTAHNTLALDKTSSSRLGSTKVAGRPGQDALTNRPSMVTLARAHDTTGSWIQSRHDGYLEGYGLLHERRLFLGRSGSEIHGEDVLLSPDDKARRRFQSRIKGAAQLGVALSIHFHLHPDVAVEVQEGSEVFQLTLPSGEVWMFTHKGGRAEADASVYLDPSLPEPVASRQIVIRERIKTHQAEIGWSFRRTVTGQAVRDLGPAAEVVDLYPQHGEDH